MNQFEEISKVLREKKTKKKFKGGFDHAIADLGVALNAQKAKKRRA